MNILLVAPAIERLRAKHTATDHTRGLLGAWGPARGKDDKANRVFRFSMLSLLTVAACAPQHHRVRLVDESVEPLDYDADVDVVGISFMTAHAPRAYEIAAEYRRRGRKVVFGGYHPTLVPQEAAEHADAIVVGEAEEAWPRLLADLEAGRPGKVYRAGQLADLKTLRRPPRELLKNQRNKYVTLHAAQATRGCPHGCQFCSVSRFFGQTHRTRPVEAVVQEVAEIDGEFVLFVDDNLTADPEYAKQLFRGLAPLGKKWSSQASIRIVEDAELLRLAAKSGCVGLFVGLESVNERSLAGANKGFNKVDEYRQAVAKLHDHGIAVESGIVFGFDQDGPAVFERTLEFLDVGRLDAIQVSVLTPLPGTGLFAQMERDGRIIDRNWRNYDYRHVVFQPARMSPRQLQDGADWVISEFYSRFAIVRRAAHSVVDLGFVSTIRATLPVNWAYGRRVRQWGIRGRNPWGRAAGHGQDLAAEHRVEAPLAAALS